jgi:hypothetical protein
MEGPPIALLDAVKLAAAKADFIKMVEGGGHRPLVQQSFGISSSSGLEAGRVLVAMWRFC